MARAATMKKTISVMSITGFETSEIGLNRSIESRSVFPEIALHSDILSFGACLFSRVREEIEDNFVCSPCYTFSSFWWISSSTNHSRGSREAIDVPLVVGEDWAKSKERKESQHNKKQYARD